MDEFRKTVWGYYHKQQRDMPWRKKPYDTYPILVSEIMLQQTQVKRVISKYNEFLGRFPDVHTLATASLADVLRTWNGLGYNRRAKYLHEAAQQLASKAEWTLDDLVMCKGIGHNTAAAVLVYSYNRPLVFIETNIRTVFIHHFFPGQIKVHDEALKAYIERTLDSKRAREWYWALMDYGSHLKQTEGNVTRRSRHYVKQSPIYGSVRQQRGEIIRQLAAGMRNHDELKAIVTTNDLDVILRTLLDEGLIAKSKNGFELAP